MSTRRGSRSTKHAADADADNALHTRDSSNADNEWESTAVRKRKKKRCVPGNLDAAAGF